MRHFCQIADDGRTGDVFAQCNGQLGFGFGKHGRRQDFAQHHILAFFVGQLDAHRVFTRDGFHDAHGLQRHGTRQVFRQGNDLAAFYALRGFDFITRNYRAGSGGHDLHADAELCQLGFNQFGSALQFGRIDADGFAVGQAQQAHAGFVVFACLLRLVVFKQRSLNFGRRRNRDRDGFAVAGTACKRGNGRGGDVFGFFHHAAGVFRLQGFGGRAVVFSSAQCLFQTTPNA